MATVLRNSALKSASVSVEATRAASTSRSATVFSLVVPPLKLPRALKISPSRWDSSWVFVLAFNQASAVSKGSIPAFKRAASFNSVFKSAAVISREPGPPPPILRAALAARAASTRSQAVCLARAETPPFKLPKTLSIWASLSAKINKSALLANQFSHLA